MYHNSKTNANLIFKIITTSHTHKPATATISCQLLDIWINASFTFSILPLVERWYVELDVLLYYVISILHNGS